MIEEILFKVFLTCRINFCRRQRESPIIWKIYFYPDYQGFSVRDGGNGQNSELFYFNIKKVFSKCRYFDMFIPNLMSIFVSRNPKPSIIQKKIQIIRGFWCQLTKIDTGFRFYRAKKLLVS